MEKAKLLRPRHIVTGGAENNQRIHNEFWLNEIKVKNEALKQLLSINALLMAGYSALLFNLKYNIDLPIVGSLIRNFLDSISKERIDAIIETLGPEYKIGVFLIIGILTLLFAAIAIILKILAIFMFLGFFISPIVCWFFSMKHAMLSFTDMYDTEHMSEISSWKYLRGLTEEKNKIFIKCYRYTMIGILLIMLIITVVVYFEVFI